MSDQVQYADGEWSREAVQGPGSVTRAPGATGASSSMVAATSVGERVRQARESWGWSQGDVARHMRTENHPNFYQTTVSRIENGARPVTVEECSALANVLRVSPIYLAGWSPGGHYESAYQAGIRDVIRAADELRKRA